MSQSRLVSCLLVALLLVPACSRSGSEGPSPEASRKSENAPSSTPPASEAPLPSAGPVLTPEDVEAETEHRITEQNLESELDRLEREIQAE